MIEQQSQELDPTKRLAQVVAIQKQLEEDAARPILDSRLDYFTVWPHVKNLVPHQSIYNFGRMQEVWRDSEGASPPADGACGRTPPCLPPAQDCAGKAGARTRLI